MGRVGRLLRIRPGEGRVAFRVLAMMFVVWGAFAIGGSAIEGLLFARVGPDALPYLFVILGVATAAVMLGMNAVLARPRPQRLLLLVLPGMSAAVVVMRGLLWLEQRWVYPVAWVAMMVLWTGVGVVTWGIAGAVHDTRQAKRLFPLYGAGLILGSSLGGVATAPLAGLLGAENLLFVWAAAVAVGFVVARSVLRSGDGVAAASRARSRSPVPVRARLAEGLRTVRGSSLLTWMSASLALFAVLYFSLSLLFARAATARFPDADALAGFLGVFMGATSAAALLVSLFGANRLYARFGVATTVVALPLVYAGGFAVLVASLAFVPLFVFRFVQMVWVNGVWAGAWQALYNVVPPERRDGARAFVDGVALQAGVVCAGVILILADRVLEPRAVAVIGTAAAALAAVASFRLRAAYAGAVVEALRAGNPDVFLAEEEPFGGVRRDGAALAIAMDAATAPDTPVRRIAVEILAEVRHQDAAPALRSAIGDDDPMVRAAALRGLARLGPEAGPDREVVARLLRDGDAAVRMAAVEAVEAGGGSVALLRPLLADPDPRVRARASALLLHSDAGAEAEGALAAMAHSPDAEWRAEAVAVMASADDEVAVAESALADPDPRVRMAAVTGLAGRGGAAVVPALVSALADPHPSTRDIAVEALVQTGESAVGPLVDAASRPELEHVAMRALARLDGVDGSVLERYVRREASLAVRYAEMARALDERDPELDLLAHSLRHQSLRHAVNALEVAGPRWDAGAVALVVENLESRDPGQRANALEALDAVGDPEVVRALIAAFEGQPRRSGDPMLVLADLLEDPNPWVRACAAFAGADHLQLRLAVQGLARSDADPAVRDAAGDALTRKEGTVETLSSLSLMERIVFLRRVPLFADLSPADLKHVGEVATEHVYPDGAVLADQGEPGDEMHVVVSGSIRVVVGADGGPPREVARRSRGECVGEMAVISRAPRMATLIADGDVRTLAIDRNRFERILRERPEASLAVMGVLCARLREAAGTDPIEAGS